jgi:Mg-chelatase subunit ChlD
MTRYQYAELANHALEPELPRFTIFALDSSGSMAQEDFPPNREKAAVAAFHHLLDVKREHYPDDMVAVVAFSDEAKIIHSGAAVGGHYAALASCLEGLEPDGNTAMGSALTASGRLCLRHLQQLSNQRWSLQIILASDGLNNRGSNPEEVARELKDDGVWIDVIGIGTPEELDETSLRAIASVRPDGKPSYCFIGDAPELTRHAGLLARHHLVPLI